MEQKNNTGAIFKNDYKKTDQHPDYKGKCLVDGTEKEIALWLSESKAGKKYFSVKFSEPYKNEDAEYDAKQAENDLPF